VVVGDREERIAKNEAVARDINERIERNHETSSPARLIRMVCECGQATCEQLVSITLAEYEQVRSDPRQFVLARGHVIPDVERIESENDRFVVVRKREGTPAAVAVEEDPRS